MSLSLTKQTQEKILIAAIFIANIAVGILFLWWELTELKFIDFYHPDSIDIALPLVGILFIISSIGMLFKKQWAKTLTIVLYLLIFLIFIWGYNRPLFPF